MIAQTQDFGTQLLLSTMTNFLSNDKKQHVDRIEDLRGCKSAFLDFAKATIGRLKAVCVFSIFMQVRQHVDVCALLFFFYIYLCVNGKLIDGIC